jgi:predicted nucleic acid-binding protein
MLVVDASVAIKWFLVEPGDREALALLDGDRPLIAPELVVAEVVNAVWKRLISGGIERAQAADVPPAIVKLFAELRPIVTLAARALEIAVELRHPAYECFYLALAEERRAKLVTADRRLLGRLAGTPWQEDAISLWH